MTAVMNDAATRLDGSGFETLLVDERDDRLVVRLHRPAVKNAIDQAMVDELHAVCTYLERTPKILVLAGTPANPDTGARAVFASGADIAQLRKRRRDDALAGINSGVFDRIAKLPMPVIAALDGFALGGGAELAYAADFRIGTPALRMGNPEANLGILAAAGATWRLKELGGEPLAKQILLAGKVLTGEDCLAAGLISELVDPSLLLDAAHTLADAIAAQDPLAIRITKAVFHEALELMADSRNLELARTYRLFRSSKHPVLVMNSETVMTDLPALAHFDAESHAYLWEMLRLHRWDQDKLRIELPVLGTEAMVRRLGRAGQDAIFALEFMERAPAPAADGVAVIHNPGSAAARPAAPALRDVLDNLSSRQSRSSPYAALQRELTAAAAVDGLLRVVGSPGSGKRHQASKWLRQHTGREPRVLDAAELTADAPAWAGMEAALREGCGIVVVGGAGAGGELPGRLAEFAQIARPGVHPGARVILTERASGPADGYVAAGLPAPVRVPPLAELRAELPDVVREVSAELFPGAPAPRFSPAALQCLLAWRWPGNVAELARLLAGLRRQAAGGLVQTKDLPAPMRQPSLSSLSRYEQSERDTIVAALAEADSNKSRAAEILGIGRTTLYRKMRALKIADDERMVAPGA